MESEKTKLLGLLIQEYHDADKKVEDYNNRQINYLNIGLALLSGFYYVIFILNDAPTLKPYFPYVSFVVYGTLVYHYRRNQIVQGHRLFLAEQINLEYEKNPLVFPDLIAKYSNNIRENWFLFFNTIIWLTVLIGVYIITHYATRPLSPHAVVQFPVIVLFIYRFISRDRKLESIAYEHSLKLYQQKSKKSTGDE